MSERPASPGAADADLYRRIVETTSEGVWVLDTENRTVLVNSSMSAMLGYSAEEMILGYTPEELRGIPPLDLVHPDDIQLASARLERLLGHRWRHRPRRRPRRRRRALAQAIRSSGLARSREKNPRRREAHARALSRPSVTRVVSPQIRYRASSTSMRARSTP